LSRRRKDSLEDARGITVGGNRVYFNKQAIRWLSVWLDSELTLKEHHDVRTKKAQNRLQRLAGQVGLFTRELPTRPSSNRKASDNLPRVQAAALFGSELWWKGEDAHGIKNRQEDPRFSTGQPAYRPAC